MITGIVVALPEELKTLTAIKITKGKYTAINDHILVVVAGTGSVNAKVAAEQLVALGARQLISWGCAAALRDSIRAGDLTLVRSLLDSAGLKDEGFGVSSAWQVHATNLLASIVTLTPAHTLVESDSIVATQEDKKRLHSESGACAVDMESVAVAKVAMQHQLPFLAVRAIADPVNMNLPLAISAALNAEGEVVLVKLLQYLLLHPGELPGLIKIGLQFNAACKTLKTVAKSLDELCRFEPI